MTLACLRSSATIWLPAVVALLLSFTCTARAQAPQAAQDAWNDDRVGMFVHWGLYSATEGAWNGNAVGGAAEWIQQGANIHSLDYENMLRPQFAPSVNWATELAQSAKAAGMEYVVLTTKHHDGFTLFNSNENWSTGASTPGKTTNPYGGSNISPVGRDLITEFADAVRAEGLKVGFYYSVIDWQHPNAYRGNNGLPTPGVMFNDRTDENTPEPDPMAGSYKEYIFNHVEELMTNYGTVDELWFDYSSNTVQDTDWNADALMQMIRANQPNIMVNNRLYNGLENPNGDLATPERTIPADGLPFNWETAQAWDNTSWGYKSVANGANYKSPREAAMIIAEAASKGGNTLLNVGPDRFGNIPTEQQSRMDDLADWMVVNGAAIKETRASGFDMSSQWGRLTMNKSESTYYAIVFDRPFNGFIELPAIDGIADADLSLLTVSGDIPLDLVSNGEDIGFFLNANHLDQLQSAAVRINLLQGIDDLTGVAGDVNQDGFLTESDIADFQAGWLADTRGLDAVARTQLGDLNLSGKTDLVDVDIFRKALAAQPALLRIYDQSVPEPSGCFLVAPAFLVSILTVKRQSEVVS